MQCELDGLNDTLRLSISIRAPPMNGNVWANDLSDEGAELGFQLRPSRRKRFVGMVGLMRTQYAELVGRIKQFMLQVLAVSSGLLKSKPLLRGPAHKGAKGNVVC